MTVRRRHEPRTQRAGQRPSTLFLQTHGMNLALDMMAELQPVFDSQGRRMTKPCVSVVGRYLRAARSAGHAAEKSFLALLDRGMQNVRLRRKQQASGPR